MNSIKKNFIWNTVGTTINAFNSLFFMIIVTRINGPNIAGIFAFAFTVATLFNIIGVYSGRVYQVTDKSKISDMDFIINKVITCSIMIVVSIIFIIFNNYDLYKSLIILILCFLKCSEAFCEVIYAILQKDEELYKVGISLTIKSILGLILFLVIDVIFKSVLFSELALLLSYLLVMIFYDFVQLKKSSFKIKKVNKNNVFDLMRKGFYPFIITFLCLYLVNASKYAIELTLTNEDQTIFGIILMPATVILLFTQFLLHPFLNKISFAYQQNKKEYLISIVRKFIFAIFLFGIFSSLCAYFIGIPILEIIYGINLKPYRIDLTLILIGASLYGNVSILSNILITMRHNLSQTICLFIISLVTIFSSYYLTKNFMIFGATMSYLISMFTLFVAFLILSIFYIRKMGDKSLIK